MERFALQAAQALNAVLPSPIQASDLEIPPNPELGDFAFPCFRLAKEMRKAPPQIAAQLTAEIQAKGMPGGKLTVKAVGPYVNFFVPAAEVLQALLGDILAGPGTGTYGSLAPKSRGSWVLEYSSPNVAKPLNIYHLRPTVMGAALDRIGRFRGFDVISINHLGDWGKQYGFLAVAFRRYGKTVDSQLTMMELVDMYVRINADATDDPTIEAEARETFLKLEQGDPAVTAIWKKCCDISTIEFERIYKRINVKFDHIWGESFYTPQIPGLIAGLKKEGLLVESEGAWVVPVTDADGKEIPPCILMKSDGASIYATRDMAAAIYRRERFKFDRMTYIVGGEQRLHFQQVFAVLKKMGLDWAGKLEHVWFGLYRFKDAKMSTRKGNFVTLEDVLTAAKERVIELMTARAAAAATEGGEAVAPSDEVAEAVAVGAAIFHDLRSDPIRDVEFDLDRMVDFEGETGPYLQYAHMRCLSILRKARETGQLHGQLTAEGSTENLFDAKLIERLQAPQEIALVKLLGQLPFHLERTLTLAKPSQLAQYLIDITQAFGAFYRECRVLGEAPELTRARLMLVEATRRVLARGMTLMGMPMPDRM